MANKRQIQNFNEDSLHQSYVESVDRIIGPKDHSTFTFPKKIQKERLAFWDSFFTKYSSQEFDEVELDINTLEPCVKQSVYKSLQAVQFWVNTGYLPSEKQILHTRNVWVTTMDVSLPEEQLNIVHDYVEEGKLNPQCGKSGSIDSYSSSSVDTATYILSNMNTTNKADTMAIMGGARHSTIVNSQCKPNVDMTQVLTDAACEKNNRATVVDNDQNSYGHCSSESFKMSKCMLQQKNTDVRGRNTSKWLISRINDDRNGNPHAESNSVYMQLLKLKENSMENNEIDNSISKSRLRKKLYTDSDSPVDILGMKSSNRTLISKPKHVLHPALDFGYKLTKKYRTFKIRRRMPFRRFNNSLFSDGRSSTLSHRKQSRTKKVKNLNSNCKTVNEQTKWDDNDSNNHSIMNNSLLHKSSIDRHRCHYISSAESIDELRQTKNKLSMSSECEGNCNKRIYRKVNNVTKRSKSINPIICLKPLSSAEIQKYKRSKQVVTNQEHEISNRINLAIMNPVVSLRRLTKVNIQQYKISDAKLQPVVRLQRLSESEIQKYIKIPNTAINISSPKIRLKRLSKSDISKNNISSKRKTSISSISSSISHQSNPSMRTRNNKIFELKRKCNERDKEFMNKHSNKVVNITKNKCSMTRRSDTISPKYNKNSNITSNISKVNEKVSRKKILYIDSTTSSSDITETTSVSDSHANINTNHNNKKSFLLNISDDDDDDEFIKFIHCPEEVLELRRREYYKRLTQRYNGEGEER